MKYSPLGIKSEYTLLTSLIKINDLINFAKQNNITARELSLSLGYNEGYISRILKGKIDTSFKSMTDTMLYFDISPAEFFAFDL